VAAHVGRVVSHRAASLPAVNLSGESPDGGRLGVLCSLVLLLVDWRPTCFMMNPGRKYEIMTGSRVSEARKLTNIQIASSPPMTALKRMLENVQSAVLATMATAVKLTAFPEVTSASRDGLGRARACSFWSVARSTMGRCSHGKVSEDGKAMAARQSSRVGLQSVHAG
jgi:hypothetical protein